MMSIVFIKRLVNNGMEIEMKKNVCVLSVLMVFVLCVGAFAADKVKINCFSNNNGHDIEALTRAAKLYMEKHPDIEVSVNAGGKNTTDYFNLLLKNFDAHSPYIDVFLGDVVWPGDIAQHLLPLNKYFSEEEISAYNPAVIQNNTINGELKAIPLLIDVPVLYYRTDLLKKYGYNEPPATWAELEEMATKIQDGEKEENSEFWGYIWQGDAYEGLTCDGLEWIYSNDGGSIIEPDKVISINNQNAIESLEMVTNWVDTISPLNVLGFQEELCREMWQAGLAGFMRNWPYAYSLGQAPGSVIKDKFDFTAMPAGKGKSASTIGGWEVFVSKYSRNPDAAADFAKFISGYEVQKFRALDYGYLPALMTVYDDPEIQANDFISKMGPIVANGVARPSTATAPHYTEVSRIFYTIVHKVISGEITAAQGTEEMEAQLKKVVN